MVEVPVVALPGRRGAGRAAVGRPGRTSVELGKTAGFLVADARRRLAGRVERPMYCESAQTPDALSLRFSLLRRRRRPVPAEVLEAIDKRTRVIGLRIGRSAIEACL